MTTEQNNILVSFRWRGLLALLLIGGFLGFIVFKNEAARSGGAEIVLETRPIDPRDIFFGHYAILSYDIQRITPDRAFDLMDDAFRAEAKRLFKDGGENRIFSNEMQPAPAYVMLKKNGDFHTSDFATLDLAKAQASGAAYLKAGWSLVRHFKNCEDDQTPGDGCEWLVALSTDLPDRYYAGKKTALALQNLQGEAGRSAAQQRRFEDCERRRAAVAEGDPSPQGCENVTVPAEEAEKFGVVLSISTKGEAVIKGIVYGDQKVLDSLNGPRLTNEQLEKAPDRSNK